VKFLIIARKVFVLGRVFPQYNYLLLKIHEGTRISFTLECSFRHEVLVNAGQDGIQPKQLFLNLITDLIRSRSFVVDFLAADFLSYNAYPFVQVVKQDEYRL
jgi:hypothetical protein